MYLDHDCPEHVMRCQTAVLGSVSAISAAAKMLRACMCLVCVSYVSAFASVLYVFVAAIWLNR